MAYLTIHRMDGDRDELLRRKQEGFDPVVREHAGAYGALFSVTARTEQGLIVVNVWKDSEGAATFTQLPEIQAAQARSNLPMPSSFERFLGAQLDAYEHETNSTR
jgi:hypothetical protein